MPIAGRKHRNKLSPRSSDTSYNIHLDFEEVLPNPIPNANRPRFILSEFAEICHLHGVYEIYHAQGFRRALWLLAFSAALGVAIYECVSIVLGFRESPVVVSYVIQEARTLPIPDIVICPFNRFDARFIERHNISSQLQQYIETSFNNPRQFHMMYGLDLNRSDYLGSESDREDEYQALLARLGMTTSELLENASIPCDDIFPICISPRGGSCCDRAEGLMSSAGKCYRIPGSVQIGNGFGFGLKIVVSLPYERFAPSLSNWHNGGFAVKLIEDQGGLEFDLTYIPVGVHALMPLRATKYEFMNNPPKFTCESHRMKDYSRLTCFDNCYHARGQAACNCSRAGSLRPRFPVCTPRQMSECFWPAYANVSASNAIEQFIFDCRQKCLPNCTYWQFTTSISYSKFPAPTLAKFGDLAKWENTSIIDLYYENLAYTVIKHHSSMTFETFVANIGGQIGLWVGGSILTTLQLLVFVGQLIWSICMKKPQKPCSLTDARNHNSNLYPTPHPESRFHSASQLEHLICDCQSCRRYSTKPKPKPPQSNQLPVSCNQNGRCPPVESVYPDSEIFGSPPPFFNLQHEHIV